MPDINAREMAAAPLAPQTDGKDKAEKRKTLLSFLGSPSFIAGDGKRYPRQTGWGANKKANPDGGTNETVAWVVFKPVGIEGVTFEGRIYLEKFDKLNGEALPKERRIYSASLPFVTREKRSASATEAYEIACDKVLDLFFDWAKSAPATTVTATKNTERRGVRVIDAD